MTPDFWAREHGWLILVPGEAYERSLSPRRAFYVYMLDDGRWQAVYYSRSDLGEKVKELVISRSWRTAFEKAHGFEEWLCGGAKEARGRPRYSTAS